MPGIKMAKIQLSENSGLSGLANPSVCEDISGVKS
jgi:hypothetical protein